MNLGTAWEVVSGSQFCQLTRGGECVTDGAGSYGNNERCTVRALVDMLVISASFDVEAMDPQWCTTYSGYCDFVQIRSERFAGTSFGSNVSMAAGDTLHWYSDHNYVHEGFVVCRAPTPPSPSVPPNPPVAPDGRLLLMPRSDLHFALRQPVWPNMTSTLLAHFRDAVHTIGRCSGPASCLVTTRAVRGSLGTYGRRRPTVAVEGTIVWTTINRTVLCPPPPPKRLPDTLHLRSFDPECETSVAPSDANADYVRAFTERLSGSAAAIEAALHQAGLPSTWGLSGSPRVSTRDAITAITQPPLPPPLPSTPPPPPSLPQPPSPPPGLCSYTCDGDQTGGDGICEDGGPGSEARTCELGTVRAASPAAADIERTPTVAHIHNFQRPPLSFASLLGLFRTARTAACASSATRAPPHAKRATRGCRSHDWARRALRTATAPPTCGARRAATTSIATTISARAHTTRSHVCARSKRADPALCAR
jgi:hypothetical protein